MEAESGRRGTGPPPRIVVELDARWKTVGVGACDGSDLRRPFVVSGLRVPDSQGRRYFRAVTDPERADFDAVRVTLFASGDRVCGWFIAPTRARASTGYAPRSARLDAAIAVVRGLKLADDLGLGLCVIDPDRLWSEVWPAD